jgi:large subunit ribosomal protein L10
MKGPLYFTSSPVFAFFLISGNLSKSFLEQSMNKAEKEVLIQEFNEIFSKAVTGILDYKGATVSDLTTLRKTLYEKNTRFRVLKNSLAKRAAMGTPFEEINSSLTETRALVYSEDDPVAAAKALSDIAKGNDKIKLIAGILVTGTKGELMNPSQIKDLANMPSREDLLVKLLYVMNAPITNFVRTLNEVPASFVRVLQAYADSKQ